MCTFVDEVELPLADNHVLDLHLRVDQTDPRPVAEIDEGGLLAPALASVQTADTHLRLDSAVESVPPPAKIISRNGRVVAHLLHVERTPADPALVGFPEDGIERLHHADTERAVGHREHHAALEPLQRVEALPVVENQRRVREIARDRLQVRPG